MESQKEFEDQAASWLARRDSGGWTDADEAQLKDWLESSTAHRVAFLRLEAVWEETARLKAFAVGMPARTVPPVGSWRRTPFFDWRWRSTAARRAASTPVPCRKAIKLRWRYVGPAAALVTVVTLSEYFLYGPPHGNRYRTPIGETASIPLEDGSNITLNTNSDIRVNLTPRERRIDLQQGEVFFRVAHDSSRPFVVHAGAKTVTAVGTQFSVWRDGDELRVVVTEGTVKLQESGPPAAESSGRSALIESRSGTASPEVVRLSAGAIARASEGDVLVDTVSVSRAEELVTWREGYLTFHETTLADAVEEFNRYNTHHIAIEDPSVAAIRISGTFRPTNYEAFVRLLEQGFSIRAKNANGMTTLTR